MPIHPNARSIISKLTIPTPIKKYFSHKDWEIDLSNNTNPYVEGFSEYPDIKRDDLKDLYLQRVRCLNYFGDEKSAQQFSLTSENILFTVGSMEGIDILLRTFCEPNVDTICIIQPTFSAYEHWGLIHNLEVKNIHLSGENLNTFPLEEVIEINPKMVFICNPNNPVGTTLTSGIIEKLCQSIHGFVVIDEAYIEFSDHPSSLIQLTQYKNLIILRTLSKAWGLAGVRCGIIMADKRVIHTLRYVQLPFGFSSPAQESVQKCLSNPEKTFISWKKVKNDRQRLMDVLSTMSAVEKVFKSETNFIMLVLKDNIKTLNLLIKNGIQVMDCSASIPSAIRVSLGTEEQNRKFIEVIHRAG